VLHDSMTSSPVFLRPDELYSDAFPASIVFPRPRSHCSSCKTALHNLLISRTGSCARFAMSTASRVIRSVVVSRLFSSDGMRRTYSWVGNPGKIMERSVMKAFGIVDRRISTNGGVWIASAQSRCHVIVTSLYEGSRRFHRNLHQNLIPSGTSHNQMRCRLNSGGIYVHTVEIITICASPVDNRRARGLKGATRVTVQLMHINPQSFRVLAVRLHS